MKVKAVIIRADRTNDVIVVPKRKIQGITFRHDNETYVLHQDRFQVTWTRPNWGFGLVRKYFSTYYYVKGKPQPLPLQEIARAFTLDDSKKPAVQVIDNGISGEEMAAIFNPWFYRVIAAQSLSMWEQIQLYATIGTGCIVLYLVYMLTSGNYHLPEVPPTGAP
jgi:hypothetical protein